MISQREGGASYIVAESLVTLSLVVTWKLDNVCSLLGDLGVEISRQNVAEDTCFFLMLIVM